MFIRRWRLAGFAAALIALGALLTLREPSARPEKIAAVHAKKKGRKVYPYSVIPGGVASSVELRNALFKDSVAASHYSGFHLDRTRLEHLDRPQHVFVSYRIADRVYWTRKRMLLPVGEAILTDGTSNARTRCGNRISNVAQFPVNPASEPSAAVLDQATPDPVQKAAETVTEILDADAVVSKLKGTIEAPGDFLSSFGPKSVIPTSGFASGSEGLGGGGGGGGAGLGGGGLAPGGTAINPAPPQSPGSSGLTVPPFVSTGPALVPNPGALLPPQLPIQTVVTQSFVEPQPAGPRSPSMPVYTTVPLTPLLSGSQPGEIVAGLPAPSAPQVDSLSALPGTPIFTDTLKGSVDSLVAQNESPHQKIVNDVPTPEPHTLLMVLCGVALLFFGTRKFGSNPP